MVTWPSPPSAHATATAATRVAPAAAARLGEAPVPAAAKAPLAKLAGACAAGSRC